MTQLVLPDPTLTGPKPLRPRAVAASAYEFVGPAGRVTLAGLFGGHRRLAVHHRMPDASLPGATTPAGEVAAVLHAADTRLVVVSHTPYSKFVLYGRHFGRDLPGYSAVDNGFGADFPATRHLDGTGRTGTDTPGLSFFRLDGRFVRHLGSIAVPYLDFLDLVGVPGDLLSD
ncbi:DUF899 family protein [Amycolatopsis tolypomycina]|uniref:Uncharacterized protein n=1 Tax=Amycolatopsis tolypomycina TaxID=208445 RepID=A0A1H5A0D6_9PSEU|nr:DUF899 family protein [Amycolatopsis tolypomycina]SED35809.1 protein of unknown function [Amycolatopsis tolypomycina]